MKLFSYKLKNAFSFLGLEKGCQSRRRGLKEQTGRRSQKSVKISFFLKKKTAACHISLPLSLSLSPFPHPSLTDSGSP
jgi:hypothetical protein